MSGPIAEHNQKAPVSPGIPPQPTLLPEILASLLPDHSRLAREMPPEDLLSLVEDLCGLLDIDGVELPADWSAIRLETGIKIWSDATMFRTASGALDWRRHDLIDTEGRAA